MVEGTAGRGERLMPWVVDTCLVIDVLDADPQYGAISADLLDGMSTEGLLLCPVSFIELAPAFGGELKRQEHFLRQINVDYTQDWTWVDTCAAFAGWHRYITLKRSGEVNRRPVADLLIGAFSMRFDGLLTRNAGDFARLFRDLVIHEPSTQHPNLSQ
jgi:predicted nucleic acid-binding protein